MRGGGVVPYAHYKTGFLPPCVNLNDILNQNHQKRLSEITLIFLHFRQTLNHTSMSIVMKFSSVTGIHKTLVSSHKDVVLAVEMDNSIPHIDPECMRVMFPTTVPSSLMGEVMWPKNPKRKRYADQIVRDCLGKQVGNVPANLAGFFRKLLTLSTYVTHITCVSTGVKIR